MDEGEYAELLTHIRMRMREAGAVVLDDEIATALLEGAQPPSGGVVAYLEHLRAAVRLRSGRAASEALAWLSEHVATDEGEPVEGLVLRPGDEWRVYGEDEVDLTASTAPRVDVTRALDGIEDLLDVLRSADDETPRKRDRDQAEGEPEGGGEFEEEH